MTTLVDRFKELCVMMSKASVPDGEGGADDKWQEGAEFQAAIVKDSTLEARVAEKDGLTNVYTVTTSPNVALNFHNVFKRVRDGQCFRVTSNGDDKRTPATATFQFEQVSAEEWVLS